MDVVQREKVLKIDRPAAGGFLSLTALRAEGCGLPCRAMLIKSALRDLSFCVIWHENNSADWLAALAPLWWLRHHLSPASGGTTNRAKLRVTYEKIASRSFVLPPLAGEVPRSGQGGMPFPTPAGRLYGFRRQRRHKKWRRRRRTSPAQRYYITPEGESPQPACKAKPITGRTLAAQGRKARRLAQPSRP